MTKEQFDTLKEQIGLEAAGEIKKLGDKLTNDLNTKFEEVVKGNMTKTEFDAWKAAELSALNDRIAETEKLKSIVAAQGEKINELEAGSKTAKGITLEEFLQTKANDLKKLQKAGTGMLEFSSDELIKAGVVSFSRSKVAGTTSIGSSVQPMDTSIGSPYLPGLGGSDLELFDIVRNPNFILNRVDVGRTNQARLAWINETVYEGTPLTNILESGTKPQVQHKFKVEFSEAKKAAAWIALTEEFETDLPGLATAVRRMLQDDVLRAFDDAIQLAVIAVARPYEITGLDGKVPFTTLFDAMGALLAQVGFYNFIPNTLALNPVTSWESLMDKDSQGRYLNPPFMDRLNRILIEATKVAVGYGLAGDLSQYKVDIYKDFTLKMGWINDQFIKNEFAILGELRYHNYISDSRKKAIVYNNLLAVQQKITAGS